MSFNKVERRFHVKPEKIKTNHFSRFNHCIENCWTIEATNIIGVTLRCKELTRFFTYKVKM